MPERRAPSAPVSGPLDLRGRVALVTGGDGGIGRAVVDALVREGARLSLTSLEERAARAIAAEIAGEGGEALGIGLDVTDQAQVEAAVAETTAVLGPIEIAVHTAGVLSREPLELDDAAWSLVLDTNLKGTKHVLQAVMPRMEAAGHGKIVLLGSIAGYGKGLVAGPGYVAAKGGVHALAAWAARRGAEHNVYVNLVVPGPVMTPMWIGANDGVRRNDAELTPLGRVGEPADVAEPIVFLASAMSNFVTGAMLDVSGGLTLR